MRSPAPEHSLRALTDNAPPAVATTTTTTTTSTAALRPPADAAQLRLHAATGIATLRAAALAAAQNLLRPELTPPQTLALLISRISRVSPSAEISPSARWAAHAYAPLERALARATAAAAGSAAGALQAALSLSVSSMYS